MGIAELTSILSKMLYIHLIMDGGELVILPTKLVFVCGDMVTSELY